MRSIVGASLIVGSMVLVAGVGPALAERPNAANMSCEAAASRVLSSGAVTMQIAPATSDRFVASRAFCNGNETIEPAIISTRDKPACQVGYRCREMSPGIRR